eukprot:g920.t1
MSSSRLCVKNLPKYVDEKRLKKHFSTQGVVTDVRIIRKKDGQSRCFGFVGFEEERSAIKAKEFFDRSFMDTSKLRVEIAKARGSKDIARPWSRHSKGSSLHRERNPEAYVSEKKERRRGGSKSEADSGVETTRENADADSAERQLKLAQFLDLAKSSKSGGEKSWADNPDLELVSGEESKTRKKKEKKKKTTEDDDMAFLRSRTTASFDSDDDNDLISSKTKKTNESEDLADTGRLFLRNLSYQCTEDAVENAFKSFGKISDIHLPVDHAGRRKGIGFIQFMFPEDAVKALTALDGQIFHGRILHILPARRRPDDADTADGEAEDGEKSASRLRKDNANGATSSWKRQKEERRKKEAGNKASWNSLFLRADTVVDSLAKQLKVKKSEILDHQSSGSMAVQMALAETHVLETTKRQLEDAGVNLDALTKVASSGTAAQTADRSKVVLIVKNLPADTTSAELTHTFAPFGEIGRFVFPEPHVIALVEFLDAAAARRAFKGLAYRRFKHVPLFLEWAPKDIFLNSTATETEKAAASVAPADGQKSGTATMTSGDNTTHDDDASASAVATIFVKNLNFATTSDRLQAAFRRRCKGVRAANVATRQSGRADKKQTLSMGYGFVEFGSHADAMTALKTAQGMTIDGHRLELKISRRKDTAQIVADKKRAKRGKKRAADPRGKEGDKLLVKNLAFESTRQEVRELFGSFGQLRSVRIPRKFDDGHRGFGFVEYISKQDAKNAFEKLSSTHFYGRRLVVEWAAEKESIEDLRAKSQRDMARTIRGRGNNGGGDSAQSDLFDMEAYSTKADFG